MHAGGVRLLCRLWFLRHPRDLLFTINYSAKNDESREKEEKDGESGRTINEHTEQLAEASHTHSCLN